MLKLWNLTAFPPLLAITTQSPRGGENFYGIILDVEEKMNILTRSALKTRNNLPYFEIPEFAKLRWVIHAFLTRLGGVSHPPYHSLNVSFSNGDQREDVFRNRERITSVFGIDPNRLILLKQLQQDGILVLKNPVEMNSSPLEYDALITDIPNLFLGIRTADCIPILVADQKRKVIAAIHAGRQGTAMHITEKVLKKMKEEFGSSMSDLLLTLGPSIGPACYEIDGKVFKEEWEPFALKKKEEKWMLDLAKINRTQMKKEGIEEEQIFRMDLCTHCHHDLFFSYRREGRTGRQLSFIGILK
jgi:YfiH family protein